MSHFIKMPNSCQDSFSMNVSISHQIHPKANYMTHAIHIKAPFSCFINNWHAVFYLFVFVFLLSNLMKKHLKQQMTPSNFRAKKLFLWVYKLWLAVEMSVWSDWCVFVLSEREWLSWCMHMSMLSLCDSGIWTSFPAYFSLFWCLAGLSSERFLLWAALKRNHNAIETRWVAKSTSFSSVVLLPYLTVLPPAFPTVCLSSSPRHGSASFLHQESVPPVEEQLNL